MNYISFVEKHKIMNYVLHAKHGKLELRADRLDQTIGDEAFQESQKAAQSFF